MSVVLVKSWRYSLAHPQTGSQYDFITRGDDIQVVYTEAVGDGSGLVIKEYWLPVSEARGLWVRLRSEGYERV